MGYQVLARKYRPRNFQDVVGQDHTIKVLINALDKDRLHHAYLFTGSRGVGKTTIARILATGLNCEQKITSEPCQECQNCTDIRNGSFVDLIEIDAASKTGVDDTRELLESVQFQPTRGRFKTYLIDEVHMLSISSFNALLKTLEEPPDHVKFLFATTELKKIPATILSRCLQFHLKNIPPKVISEYLVGVLQQESISHDQESVDIIAQAAKGSMRDALSIADQGIGFSGGQLKSDLVVDMLGIAREDETIVLLEGLTSGDREGLFALSRELADRGINFDNVLANLQSVIHEISVAKAASSEPRRELYAIAARCTPEWLQTAYQILLLGGRDMQYAPDPAVGFEMTMIRLLDFEPVIAYGHPVKSGPADNGREDAPQTNNEFDTSSESTSKLETISDAARGKPMAEQINTDVSRSERESFSTGVIEKKQTLADNPTVQEFAKVIGGTVENVVSLSDQSARD